MRLLIAAILYNRLCRLSDKLEEKILPQLWNYIQTTHARKAAKVMESAIKRNKTWRF